MTNSSWHFDEFKHIGVDFADPTQVEQYDKRQHTNRAYSQALVERLNIKPGDKVVEFGPGTGSFSRAAAANGALVQAVDISPAMLDYAARQAHLERLETISFIQAGFLSFACPDDAIDFVVTEYAFHHLPDFWKGIALTRIHNMLRPGGTFFLRDVVFSFPPEAFQHYIEQWIDEMTGSSEQSFSRADFEMHVRDEYSTYSWLLEALMQRAGLIITERQYSSPTYAEYLCHKPDEAAERQTRA